MILKSDVKIQLRINTRTNFPFQHNPSSSVKEEGPRVAEVLASSLGSIFNGSASLEILLGMTLPLKPGREKDLLLSMRKRTNECTKKPFFMSTSETQRILMENSFRQAWREHWCSSNSRCEVDVMFLLLSGVYEAVLISPFYVARDPSPRYGPTHFKGGSSHLH